MSQLIEELGSPIPLRYKCAQNDVGGGRPSREAISPVVGPTSHPVMKLSIRVPASTMLSPDEVYAADAAPAMPVSSQDNELGTLYSFVFLTWRLCNEILVATKVGDPEISIVTENSSNSQVSGGTDSTAGPSASVAVWQKWIAQCRRVVGWVLKKVKLVWETRVKKFDVESGKVACRIALTMLVASWFCFIPGASTRFDSPFLAAVRQEWHHSEATEDYVMCGV